MIDESKFKVARKVLAEFKRQWPKDRRATLYSYDNGREQGYRLVYMENDGSFVSRASAFSENRNSDHIVVYLEDGCAGGVPTEEAYNSRLMFSDGEYDLAATAILRWLRLGERGVVR